MGRRVSRMGKVKWRNGIDQPMSSPSGTPTPVAMQKAKRIRRQLTQMCS